MATYYNLQGSSGDQHYFNQNMSMTSQSYRSQASPIHGSTTYTTTEYSAYPTDYITNSNLPYQSVAGFNRNVTQHQSSLVAPPPQVRARIRSVGHQEQYGSLAQPIQVSPQYHHFQFDNHQQPGHPTGPPVVYQTPGAAQFTHRNVDLWTETPGRGVDHYVQAQRVTVRSVSAGSPQQSQSVSPSRHQDSLQHYYSQLTPEQHQQLLHRQQQVHSNLQQVSPSLNYRSTTTAISGEDRSQTIRARSESERQRQEQRVTVQDQSSHPVGIRSLMSKFAPSGSSNSTYQQRSRSTASRNNYSSLNSSLNRTSNKLQTGNLLSKLPTMTYSALPKPREPPVNSIEYFQMQSQQFGGHGVPNIQQAAAPAHIQHASLTHIGVRDRLQTGSLSDQYTEVQKQPAPSTPKLPASSLTSLRDQYLHQAEESIEKNLPPQPVHHIPRTIIGEDLPQQKAPVSKVYQVKQATPQQASNEKNNGQEGEDESATNDNSTAY